MKRWNARYTATSAVISCLAVCLQLEQASFAVEQPPSRQVTTLDRRVAYIAQARPPKRRIGGLRGNGICGAPSASNTLTAIVPTADTATTVSDAPIFLFFIPAPAQSGSAATFRLQSDDRTNIPPISVPLTGAPGIVKVQVPPGTLKPDTLYTWSFNLSCGKGRNANLSGTVRRMAMSPSLAQQLAETISSQRRAALLQAEHSSLDAAALLAETQKCEPTARTQWEQLLRSLELPELIGKPIIP